MNGENLSAPKSRQAGNNAFGLYLIVGVLLALLVTIVFGLLGERPEGSADKPHAEAAIVLRI